MERRSSAGARPATDAAPLRDAPRFRGDINGLRALAIVPVVAFHAGVAALPGGFVGVDVFYVISGFLITSILVRELDATGTVRLVPFWAKRVRRLAPALAVVVVVTLCATLVLVSPVRWTAMGIDGVAALLSVSNVVFAARATDYFAEGLVTSPLLHTWSLGVEEQFYLVWPVLLVAVGWLARRVGASPRRALAAAFVVTIVFSFGLSVLWTPVEPSWSFYLLPTRAWEFAVAGLLALAPIGRVVRSRRTADAVGLLGIVLLGVAVVGIDADAVFPGWIAAVPVVGTLLVIAAGTANPRAGVARVLAARPLQWIGSVSYSWYLWHWPFIVLAGIAVPATSESDALVVASLAALASLGAAALTSRFVETPVRFHGSLVASSRRTLAVVGSVTAAALVASVAIVAGGAVMTAQEPYRTLADVLSDVPDQSCVRESTSTTGPVVCELGDIDATETVMLVGDSHAGHWKEAMGEAARAAGVRLVVRWRSSCPAIPVDLLDTRGARDTECRDFQDDTMALVAEVRPDVVILAQSAAYGARILGTDGERLAPDERLERWGTALETFLADVEGGGARPALVVDNPRLGFDPIECVARSVGRADACAAERSEALARVESLNGVGHDVADARGTVATFDVTDDICDAQRCYAQRGGVPVFRDGNHLSEVWTATRVADLREWLTTLLR